MKVSVIDYGVGNLGSVVRALYELGVTASLITKPTEIRKVDKLILPGVGNFADCINTLTDLGWTAALRDEVLLGEKPLLGICLGMQLLATSSMEGAAGSAFEGIPGLGFIPGHVKNLRNLGCKLRIPHVGWNEVNGQDSCKGVFEGIPSGTDFYFVHSFAFVPDDPVYSLATCNYDIPFSVAVGYKNIFGTQFHPEKSSRAGFRLLRNFVENSYC